MIKSLQLVRSGLTGKTEKYRKLCFAPLKDLNSILVVNMQIFISKTQLNLHRLTKTCRVLLNKKKTLPEPDHVLDTQAISSPNDST